MRPISTSEFAPDTALEVDPALLGLVGSQIAEALGERFDDDKPAMLEKMTPLSLIAIVGLALVAWAPVAAGIALLV